MAKFIISAFADEAGGSLAGQIAALKRNGLDHIELRAVDGGILDKSEEEIIKIHEELEKSGIKLSALGSPIGKFDIDGDFEAYLETFKKALRYCRLLGTQRMRMFSFFVPQERLDECRDEVFRRLSIMLELAEAAGITLCHENESLIYGQAPEQVAELLNGLDGLYGIFDAANYVMNDLDPIKGMDATIGKLAYLHIKDALRADKAMVPVGMGDGRYPELIDRVDKEFDDTIILTLEPHLAMFDSYKNIDSHQLKTGLTFETPDDAFDCAVRALKKLLSELGFEEGEDRIWKK